MNVDRLRRDMHSVHGQILASQHPGRDCDPHQPHDADQEANPTPRDGKPMDSYSENPPARKGLICSPIEQEDEGLDAN